MRGSQRLQRWLPWIAGVVLAAGVAAFAVAVFRDEDEPRSADPRTTPLPRQARTVAGRFILTAVTRKDLPAAWKLAGAGIRQDLTYEQWLTGDIPVVPYTWPIRDVRLRTEAVYANQAEVQVLVVPKSAKHERQAFFMVLKRTDDDRWVVDYWAPRGSIDIPRGTRTRA